MIRSVIFMLFFALATAAAGAQTVVPGSQLPLATPAPGDVLIGIHGGTLGVGGTTSKMPVANFAASLTAPYTITGPHVVMWGDSIAVGFGSTSGNDACTKVATALGLSCINLGIGGTTMEHQSGLNCGGIDRWNVEPPASYTVYPCNTAVAPATTHSLIWYAQNEPGDLFILEYVTNDALNYDATTGFTPALFASNYGTVVAGITAPNTTVSPDHLVLLGEPYQQLSPTCGTCGSTFPEGAADLFTSEVALVALSDHTRYADTKRSMIAAATTSADFTPNATCNATNLLYDFAHPCTAGYAAIALAIEGANYVQVHSEPSTATGYGALATPCNVVLSAAYVDICSAQIISGAKNFSALSAFSNGLSISNGLVVTSVGASITGPMSVTGAITGTTNISATGIIQGSAGACPGASGAPCMYSGTGAPAFSAPNGSVYLRYDGTPGTNIFYLNTSGTSTIGTTWTAKF